MVIDYQAELDQFKMDHPYPDESGVRYLFKYMTYSAEKKHRLEGLLVHKNLYHALPSQLNDPFECKPRFRLPSEPQKLANIAMHFHRVALDNGFDIEKATKLVVENMVNPEKIENAIVEAARNVYGSVRVCSYTTHSKNLLLWSHYANSHSGLCVEFDAKRFPVSYAYKVKYCNEYPFIEYPRPENELGFIPVLVKSLDWAYEDEYRSVFAPEAPGAFESDGESVKLSHCDITGIYLGAAMTVSDISSVIGIIEKGPFNPSVYQAKISDSSYELEFVKI